jgi:phosphoglycerate dehydrogenase-like enzyme
MVYAVQRGILRGQTSAAVDTKASTVVVSSKTAGGIAPVAASTVTPGFAQVTQRALGPFVVRVVLKRVSRYHHRWPTAKMRAVSMAERFQIGVTRDFLKQDGSLGFGDIGLSLLDSDPNIAWSFLSENEPVLRPQSIAAYDGLLVLAPKVTAASLEVAQRLKVVARFGVGYDNVDVDACTRQGVALTITPDGVRRPVAVAAMTLLLALSHKLLIKDRLTRDGRWAEKLDHMGRGVTGRTLGIVGLGNIGREVLRLAGPFDMRFLAFDPHVSRESLDDVSVSLVSLDELLRQSDYVVVCCALTDETRHLINEPRLRLMKPTSYLINVARGPVVDQRALTRALQDHWIAGAGLDVFEQEPIDPADPLLALDNVIVAPHAICWTDECFLNNGRSACRSLLDVAAGRRPKYVVNPAAFDHPRWQ